MASSIRASEATELLLPEVQIAASSWRARAPATAPYQGRGSSKWGGATDVPGSARRQAAVPGSAGYGRWVDRVATRDAIG